MRNLFDTDTYNETIERINRLTPSTQAKWGKMNVSQAMAHMAATFFVALSEKKLPRMFLGYLIGPFIKSQLYNDKPWKRNLPTAPMLLVRDEREFEKEKSNLLETVKKFYSAGPTGITKHPHPMFGRFTPEQWGQSMFKHMDHHLSQFGV